MLPTLEKMLRRLATSQLQRTYALYKHRSWRYKRLSKLVESVICVDVGAAHFPHPKWWLFLESPKTLWLAIDPALESLQYTERWRWKCSVKSLPIAVSANSGKQTLYVTKSPTGSSLLRPRPSLSNNYRYTPQNCAYFFPVSERNIDVVGIGALLNQYDLTSRFILKLDTQGSEFSILSGMSDFFTSLRVIAVECEVSLLHLPPYEDAPRLWDVVGTMEARGFELLQVDVIEKTRGTRLPGERGAAAEADAIFILRREFVITRELNFRLQLLCVYVTYGLFEEANLLLRDDPELADFLESKSRLGGLKLK